MEDIFPISRLAKPAATEEMLPRHVRYAHVVCVDRYLLVTKLELIVYATRFVAQQRKPLDKIIYRSLIWGVRSWQALRPKGAIITRPRYTISPALRPCYALI